MGTYPQQYPTSAIVVAEDLMRSKVRQRLTNEGWVWTASPFLLSSDELESVRLRFVPGVKDELLVRFLGLVFSKTLPGLHFRLTTDGYLLRIQDQSVVIEEQPPGFSGHQNRPKAFEAGLKAVRSIIEWRLASFRESNPSQLWPRSDKQEDLVMGSFYPWIRQISELGYCRTRDMIDFVQAAVPELRAAWEADGLTLGPVYHEVDDRHFVALRLQPAIPA
jgi:hypothetical protein